MITFKMALTDPYPGFQGHGIFEVLGQSHYKNTNRKL